MGKQIINFSVKERHYLNRDSEFKTFAIDAINSIEAHFDICPGWSDFERRLAVWYTEYDQKSSTIDENGITVIPREVLYRPGTLRMNLSFSNLDEKGIVKERMTTPPVNVLKLV